GAGAADRRLSPPPERVRTRDGRGLAGEVFGRGRPPPMTNFPLAPGATIGILGGGQLGRMLAMAAARLGFDTAILTPEADSPAARVAAHAIVAAYDDPAALRRLADLAQVITFEFEN